MADVTVLQFADVLKVPVEKLLAQLDEAGIKVSGSDDVIKSLTTPSFHLSKVKSTEIEVKQKQVDDKNLRNPIKLNDKMNDISILLRAMKKEIKKNSEFVGDDFVKEVRSMKVDKTKERSIYGHGTKKEIEELKEEGVNVLNIPWIPDDH